MRPVVIDQPTSISSALLELALLSQELKWLRSLRMLTVASEHVSC